MPGLPFAILFLTISTFSVCVLVFLLRLNKAEYERSRTHRDFIDYLYRVLYCKASGSSYFRALDSAAVGTESEKMRDVEKEASRKKFLGGSFLEHFRSSEELGNYDLLPAEHSDGTMKELHGITRAYEHALKGRVAEIEESAQRYATLNMFISTILPSFLVFAFIGGAILSQSGSGMLLFSLSFLVIIPLVYSAGNLIMQRRLIV